MASRRACSAGSICTRTGFCPGAGTLMRLKVKSFTGASAGAGPAIASNAMTAAPRTNRRTCDPQVAASVCSMTALPVVFRPCLILPETGRYQKSRKEIPESCRKKRQICRDPPSALPAPDMYFPAKSATCN